MSTVVKREARIHEFPKPVEVAIAPSKSQLFLNRELSLLAFHARVLEEALDTSNPLLERLKFVSIFSSNLDEFFMIRVSGLKEELEQGITDVSADGTSPAEQLSQIRDQVLKLVAEQGRMLREDIMPQLNEAGVQLVSYESLSRHEKQNLKDYFMERVFPILTPLAVDPSHPFPYISPLSVNIGLRWEPFIPLRNTYSWASNFDQARFDQGVKSTVYPQAPAGLLLGGLDDHR